ncbi:MAG: DMT family transporter [Clostridiales Family XIII bacterium]|jgi:drug/metabolite transporter (DMT)-like permease|nr:DMT family transporter [Clostridiales Family XIII bacterium]
MRVENLSGEGRQRLGDLLVGVSMTLWGTSYFLSDRALDGFGPFTLTAVRFSLAFAILVIALFPKLRRPSRATLFFSLVIGLVLLYIYSFSNYGLLNTSVSNAGFLSNLAVVITPVISTVFLGKKPERKVFVAIVLCGVGVALLTLTDKFVPRFGDALCLLCSLGCAAHLLLTDRAVNDPRTDAVQIGVFQIGFCALFTSAAAFIFESSGTGLPKLPDLHSGAGAWTAMALLTVLCTAIPFVIQPVAQRWTGAMRAGVIFSMEPVVAGVVAFFLAHEILSARSYLGAAILVFSLLYMELDLPNLIKRRASQYRDRI